MTHPWLVSGSGIIWGYSKKRLSTTIINGAVINGREEEPSSSFKKFAVQLVQKSAIPSIHSAAGYMQIFLRTSASANTRKLPMFFYLSNVENSFRAAAIGSAFKIHDLSKYLPSGSGVYVGNRFDEEAKLVRNRRTLGTKFGASPWLIHSKWLSR